MSWKFWQQTAAKRRLQIPAESVRDILEMYDDAQKNPSRVARYDLWQCIVDIFPEVAAGEWCLEFKSAVAVYVVEQ